MFQRPFLFLAVLALPLIIAARTSDYTQISTSCTRDTIERTECVDWTSNANACEWDQIVKIACPCSCREWRLRNTINWADLHRRADRINNNRDNSQEWTSSRGCIDGTTRDMDLVSTARSLQDCIGQCERRLGYYCKSVEFRHLTGYCELSRQSPNDVRSYQVTYPCASDVIGGRDYTTLAVRGYSRQNNDYYGSQRRQTFDNDQDYDGDYVILG